MIINLNSNKRKSADILIPPTGLDITVTKKNSFDRYRVIGEKQNGQGTVGEFHGHNMFKVHPNAGFSSIQLEYLGDAEIEFEIKTGLAE